MNIKETTTNKSILCMMLSSTSFVMMATMVKLSGSHLPLMQQVFFRNLVMLIFSYWIIRQQGTSLRVKPVHRSFLAVRCLFGFLGVICVFYANNHLYLADAQILQKLNPFFVTFWAFTLLKEKVTWKRVATILLGFIGAVVVINPTGTFGASDISGGFTSIFPFIVGIASAFFGGTAYAMVGRLAGAVEGIVIIFYFSVFSIIVSAFFLPFNWVWPDPVSWIHLILIGVFAAGGQYFITKAYTTGKASSVALFDYTGVIISPIVALIVFDENLKMTTLIGMAIIIASGIWSMKLKR
ncbi:MAG: DMT family transporter [Clostridiales bacterium]|nr:DMT family transporter [Clostridiales bacterium]